MDNKRMKRLERHITKAVGGKRFFVSIQQGTKNNLRRAD